MPSWFSSLQNYTIDRCYQCGPFIKSAMWFERIASGLFVIFGLIVLIGSIYIQIRDRQFYPVPTFFPVIFFSIAIITFIVNFNRRSDICVNNEYLFVDFFFQIKPARLDDIVGIRRIPVFLTDKKPFVILFKDGLTPYHRLHGLIYGHSFYRGVYVSGRVSNREELERLVERYL